MKNWLVVRGKIKTTYVRVIVCHLALIISLCACTSPTFPSGTFSIKAYIKEPSIESTQQNNIKEDVENNFSVGEVITPENADQVTIVDRINTGSCVYSMAISPDGRLLATGGRGVIKLWDTASGEALRTLEVSTNFVRGLAFSPDGRMLAAGGWEDNTIRLWDTDSGETLRTLEIPTNQLNDLAFSPDGRILAAGGYDVTVLWEVENGQLLSSFYPDNGGVSSLAFSPDGRILAVGGYDGIVLWDAVSWERLHKLDAHTNNLTFSPDGLTLASGGALFEPNGNVILWGTESGSQLRMLDGYNDAVMSLAFSPDGRLVVAAGWNGIVLWEVASGKILNTFFVNTANDYTRLFWSVAFSPDGQLLASVTVNSKLYLWGIP